MISADILEMIAKKIEKIINRNLGRGQYNYCLIFFERDAVSGLKAKSVSDLLDPDLSSRLEYAAEKLRETAAPAECDTIH
jgi:hypothetical protein